MRKISAGFIILVSILGVSLLAAGPETTSSKPASPMMQEIQAALADEDAALATLQQELQTAPTEQDALRILRAISQQKQEAEITVLRIQARYAREAGQQEAAARIDQAIEKILNPQPVKPSPEAQKERDERRAGGQGHE